MRRISPLTLLLAAACGQPGDDLRLGSAAQAIIDGQLSPAADDAVVYLLTDPAEGDAVSCTGTLVAPNLVVTALHCVTRSSLGVFACKPDGTLSVPDQADGRIGPLLSPDEVTVTAGADVVNARPSAVGAQLFGTGSTQICRGDVAYVVLDRALDLPVAPVRLSYGVERGETVRVVGYGQTETYGDSGRHSRGAVPVIDVGPDSEDERSLSASPRTFVVSEGPCHGDSGGPAFSEETGAVLGVYSLTAGTSCDGIGIRNVYTRLSSFAPLARQAFEAAGAEPVLDEAEPEPERPEVVPENGCALAAASSAPRGPLAVMTLVGFGLLAFFRRRA